MDASGAVPVTGILHEIRGAIAILCSPYSHMA